MEAGNMLLNTSYFVVVTTLTIGYGDIYSLTSGTKMDTVFLVLAGILVFVLGSTVIYNIKWWLNKTYFSNVKGLKKDCLLFGLSLVGVVGSIGIEMLGIFLLEHMESDHYKMTVKDYFYLSMLILATIGYGDSYFRMKGGKAFAIPWILELT
ncbi:two-pore potassium channel 4-like [Rosa rugosa]|uniref:two-pore potassium channel 4-like n=1 Tax=Rosa rugosa TaxID=74645 RepID=UPI002B410AFB|nr:two-pore potassium channel 4-like [Rosa rugosa]